MMYSSVANTTFKDHLLGYEPADLTVHPPPQNC